MTSAVGEVPAGETETREIWLATVVAVVGTTTPLGALVVVVGALAVVVTVAATKGTNGSRLP